VNYLITPQNNACKSTSQTPVGDLRSAIKGRLKCCGCGSCGEHLWPQFPHINGGVARPTHLIHAEEEEQKGPSALRELLEQGLELCRAAREGQGASSALACEFGVGRTRGLLSKGLHQNIERAPSVNPLEVSGQSFGTKNI
jgi:hypothetical protein